MGDYVVIRPEGDATADQVSEWADDLLATSDFARHTCVADVDGVAPADTAHVLAALTAAASVVFYFGHGTATSWLTNGAATVDATNVSAATGKSVVSIACRTGSLLGGDAITNGVHAWLGFTVRVPVLARHKNVDPVGGAFLAALSHLGRGGTMQDAHDAIVRAFDDLMVEYDTGTLSRLPTSVTGYYAAMAVRDHVVLHAARGGASAQPLR